MSDSLPAVPLPPVKDGTETTEYQRTKHASAWGIVGLILGGLITLGPALVDKFTGGDTNSNAYIIAGAVLSVASIVYKALVDLGYIKARADVKVSANLAKQ